jgi:catecholate siderophore receptor
MGAVAFAQNPDEQPVLPEVVVPGKQESYKAEEAQSPKYTEPLRDVPQTITVVPQEVIEEQNATTLRDVLRNVSGISIQAGEGGVPAGDNLSIRGFNARTDIFIDGVRDFGGYSRDSFTFDQVEVLKGPASSYAGRGSTGGSINIVSKYPRANPFYDAAIGVGTDSYKRVTFDVNQPIGIGIPGTALRVNGLWHDADVPGRDEVTNQRWGIAPSLSFGLGTPTRVTLGYFHMDQDNMPDYGIPWVPNTNTDPVLSGYINDVPPVPFSNFYGLNQRDFEETHTDLGTLIIDHDFSDAAAFRNLTRYGQTRRDSVITAPRFTDLDPGPATVTGETINRNLQSRDQTDQILANLTDLTFRFNTGGVSHALVTGIEYTKESEENFARTGPAAPTTNVYTPNPDDPYPGPITRSGAKTDATSTSKAAYVFDTIGFGPHWDLVGGLRWDVFSIDYESTATNGVVTPLERTDRMMSWRAGVVYKPQPNGSVYASAGTSFNPSAEGLSLSETATAANNINVDPEENITFEVGTKWDVLSERLLLSAAIFRTDKTNARTEDPTDPADVVVLEGKQRVDGLELGATGNLTSKWTTYAAYTFLDSENVESKDVAEIGNELPNTPKHTFSLWTVYQLPAGFEVGGGAQFVDSRFSNVDNLREAPSYWLFDAMAAYRATEALTLRLNLNNLADEEYLNSVGGGHVIPGAARSAVLTAELGF